jgi:phospholipase/carboxylesterase
MGRAIAHSIGEMEFSLFHHAAPRRNGGPEPPPMLVLLHGYGANEDDLFSLAPYLDDRFLILGVRAPVRLGPMSYAWFNLGFTPEGVVVKPEEIETARLTLHRFLGEAVMHYGADRNGVYLMGFSQGAMMSLAVALTFPGSAAGVAAMSGRLLPQTVQQITDSDALIGLPIFVAHGTRDPLLPIGHGRDIRTRLEALPVDLSYQEYDIAHEVSPEELHDVARWLSRQLDRAVTIN